MDGNSPGKSPAPSPDKTDRGRSGLSNRVNFFEQVWRGRNRSPSVEKRVDHRHADGSDEDDDVDNDQSAVVLQLEKEMEERRRRASPVRQVPSVRPLRRVVSPVRGGAATVDHFNFAALSETAASTRSRLPHPTQHTALEIPPVRIAVSMGAAFDLSESTETDEAQPPWRLQHSPRKGSDSSLPPDSPRAEFSAVPPPSSALSKYHDSKRIFQELTPTRRASEMPRGLSGLADAGPASLRKSSQPEWYSEYRSRTLSQASSRLELLRSGITDHYDFHINQIKGNMR